MAARTPSPFELEARPLTPEDAAWLSFFDAGQEWWSDEVTGFLRQHSLAHGKAGYNTTVLFSLPKEKHVVGFLAVAPGSLQLSRVQGAYPKFGPPPGVETTYVPVWLVPYFGVHRNFQGQAYGDEMHLWLLQIMEGQIGAPRFLTCSAGRRTTAASPSGLDSDIRRSTERPSSMQAGHTDSCG